MWIKYYCKLYISFCIVYIHGLIVVISKLIWQTLYLKSSKLSRNSQILIVRYSQANGKISFVFCFTKSQQLVSLVLIVFLGFQLNVTLKIPNTTTRKVNIQGRGGGGGGEGSSQLPRCIALKMYILLHFLGFEEFVSLFFTHETKI